MSVCLYVPPFFRHDHQMFMQDKNVACRWICAWPSGNLASMRGDGKCRVDAHEIHTCLYNMTITWLVKHSEQSYVLETVIHKNTKFKKMFCFYPSRQIHTCPHFVLPVHKTGGRVSAYMPDDRRTATKFSTFMWIDLGMVRTSNLNIFAPPHPRGAQGRL